MKRTEYNRYYMEILVYRGDIPNVDQQTRKPERIAFHRTDVSELRARRHVLESAWSQGLFVLEIKLLKTKPV